MSLKKLSKVKVSENSVEILGAGEHEVVLIGIQELNDRMSDWNGTPKTENLPPWSDLTAQVGLKVAGKNGVKAVRLSLQGYLKFEDLSDKQKKSGKYTPLNSHNNVGAEAYACIENEDGEFERVESDNATAECMNIISRVAHAGGFDSETDILTALTEMVEEKIKFTVVVKEKTFAGKARTEITSFKKLSKQLEAVGAPADEM